MARIRTVKIGFFRNEDLCAFSHAHRLLFQGLWLLADRVGRLEDRPRRIHADVFPFDPALDVHAMLSDLAAGDRPFIQRYEVHGRGYIQVLNFLKHQRPHHKEPESEIPKYGAKTQSPGKVGARPGKHRPDPLGREGNGSGNGSGNGEGEGNGGTALSRLPASPAALQAAWNAGTTAPIPKCLELSPRRRVKAKGRLQERPLSEWVEIIARIEASPFCRGDNDRGWVATFEWLLQPDVAVKVLEGQYAHRARAPAGRLSQTARTIAAARSLL